MTNIYIDICIPFYLYNQCPLRMIVTKLILHHYSNLIIHFKNKYNSLITMTFIGSENNISENFIQENFKQTYSYHEFDQSIYSNLLHMLTNKFRYAYKKSMEKNPHISLLAGSNDFISMNFFEQIINNYNPNIKQLFGIDNFYNGYNRTALDLYNGGSFLQNLIWTTGLSDYSGRQKYKYIGGIIGFNNILYQNHYNELMNQIITFDEGEIEYLTLQLPDIYKFQSQNVFFINIKTTSNSEITTFNTLNNITKKQNLKFEYFDSEFKENFKNEYTYFLINYQTNIGEVNNEWFLFKQHFIKKNNDLTCKINTFLKSNNKNSSSNIIKQNIIKNQIIYCQNIIDFDKTHYKINLKEKNTDVLINHENINNNNEWFLFKNHFIKKNNNFICKINTFLKANTLNSSNNIIKQNIKKNQIIYCRNIIDFDKKYYKIII